MTLRSTTSRIYSTLKKLAYTTIIGDPDIALYTARKRGIEPLSISLIEQKEEDAASHVKPNKSLEAASSIALSSAYGYVLAGPVGTTASLVTAADEYLMSHTIFSKHYLSNFAYWMFLSSHIVTQVIEYRPDWSQQAVAGSVIFSILSAKYTDDVLPVHEHAQIIRDTFGPISELIGIKDFASLESITQHKGPWQDGYISGVNKLLHNKVAALFSLCFALDLFNAYAKYSIIKAMCNGVTNVNPLALLKQAGGDDADLLRDVCTPILSVILADAVSTAISWGTQLLASQYDKQIQSNVFDMLCKHQASDNPNIAQYPTAINTLLFTAQFSFNKCTTAQFNTLLAMNNVMRIDPGGVCIVQFGSFMQTLLRTCANKLVDKLCAKDKYAADNAMANLMSEVALHNTQMLLSNTTDLVKSLHEEVCIKGQVTGKLTTAIESASSIVCGAASHTSTVLSVFYYMMQLKTGALTWDQAIASFQLSSAASGNYGVLRIGSLEIMIKQVNAIHHPPSHHVATKHYGCSIDQAFVLRDYKLGKLLAIDKLVVSQGAIICLKGQNGRGKTTLLKDLHDALPSSFDSHGAIDFGMQKNDVRYVGPTLFVPSVATLLQTILNSTDCTKKEDITAQLIKMFQTVYPESEYTDASKAFSRALNETGTPQLSAGQQQVANIIRVILAQPKLLFADECFSNLDAAAVPRAKQLLKQSLPNCTIVVVDHSDSGANQDGFYTKIVNLDDFAVSAIGESA